MSEFDKGEPLVVNPLTREDVKKLAFDVLADLGDEVINKAIEEGKIVLPANIDLESIPHIEADIDTLTQEQFELVKGKAWLSIWQGAIAYPLFFNEGEDAAWILFEHGGAYETAYYIYDEDDGYVSGGYQTFIPGTKLYRHEISFEDTNDTFSLISFHEDPYTNVDQLIDLFGLGISGVIYDDTENLCSWAIQIVDYNGEIKMVGYSLPDGGITNYVYDAIASDTVTELQKGETLMYRSETLDPEVVNEPKEKPVRDFNEQEVGMIVKKYLVQHPEVLDEALASRSMQEVVESYPNIDDVLIRDGEDHELTPEIYTFIEKCVKLKKVKTQDGYFLELNMFVAEDNKIKSSICFGCKTEEPTEPHSEYGAHMEIFLTEDTYCVYWSEL